MLKRAIFLVLLLSLVSHPMAVLASDWGELIKEGDAVVLVDRSSIVGKNGLIKYWLKYIHTNEDTTKVYIQRFAIRCGDHNFFEYGVFQNYEGGKLISSGNTPSFRALGVQPPDSVPSLIQEFMCRSYGHLQNDSNPGLQEVNPYLLPAAK